MDCSYQKIQDIFSKLYAKFLIFSFCISTLAVNCCPVLLFASFLSFPVKKGENDNEKEQMRAAIANLLRYFRLTCFSLKSARITGVPLCVIFYSPVPELSFLPAPHIGAELGRAKAFRAPGFSPYVGGGKKGEFRDWTRFFRELG